LLSKEDIGSYRPIRRVRTGAFWMYSAHARWYASCPSQTQASPTGTLIQGTTTEAPQRTPCIYIGLDVHKATISYSVKDASGQGSWRRQDWGDALGTGRLDEDSSSTLDSTAREATIFTGWIYDHLLPHTQQVKVGHPLWNAPTPLMPRDL